MNVFVADSLASARKRTLLASVVVLLLVLAFNLAVVPPSNAASIGTGAVSVKGPGSELIPGVAIEIRKDSCDGDAVWRTTTTNRPDAYGAFGIGLSAGAYCVVPLSAPDPYATAENVEFVMEERPGNWITVWLAGPPPVVSGALVAKDAQGAGVNGVTAYISRGECGGSGGGVWQNTTASSRWSTGGFGISLEIGRYCAATIDVPSGYSVPAPVSFDVIAPGPVWVTLWTQRIPYSGTTDDVISVDILSGTKIIEFSCPTCQGNVIVWGLSVEGYPDLLVNEIGTYSGRVVLGLTDYSDVRYTEIEVQARGAWQLAVTDTSTARQVWRTAAGVGDDVVNITAPGRVAAFSHHGSSNFMVVSRQPGEFADFVVNEIGTYWGRKVMSTPSLVQVRSSGSWQIDVG